MPSKDNKRNTNKETKTNTKKSTSNKIKTTVETANTKKITTKKTSNTKKGSTTKKASTKKVSTRKKEQASTIEYYDLPNNYNQTIVKVLFQTPKKLFVYWEISEADKEKLLNENGNDFFQNSTPFLIVTNKTKNYSFEIEINDFANSWYFDVPDSKCEYNVELIRKDKLTNNSTSITVSNELEVPNNHILFEQNRHEVFFKNVKTNEVISKNIARLQLINHLGHTKPATLNEFYNKFYNEKDLYSISNPSS